MNKYYRRFVMWVMNTELYKYTLQYIIPDIRFTMKYTQMTGIQFNKMYSLLKPGDVILTVDKRKLTSLLIPGTFSHAAMCIDKNSDWEVSEMTHDDYTKSCFFDVCKESDRVVILRVNCTTCFEGSVEHAITKCKEFEDVKYDTQFDLNIHTLYCSELIYQSYINNSLQVCLDDFIGLGRQYISPDGLYNAKQLRVVVDSDQIA